MGADADEVLLAEIIRHHEDHGVLPSATEIAAMAGGNATVASRLADAAQRYLSISASLDTGAIDITSFEAAASLSPGSIAPGFALPAFEGFRTIERIGAGGMGEIYKLKDLTLDRVVAAKVIRRQAGGLRTTAAEFLREAKSLALFSDPRIVRIFECRTDTDPAVIIMEFVEGFELGRLAPSLEFRQRARIMREVCDAVAHAHTLGIQHRDLKPSNIMLDGALSPKILDFGLSDSDSRRGHLRGTPAYIAPEQIDPSQPIDARTDVYALGVIFYELLCGATPYADSTAEVLSAVQIGRPRLPIEIDSRVPDPLQAVALKAMEKRPADRYQSARDMVRDLDRYLAGLPVTARPTQYAATLAARVAPHLEQVAEWLRLKLVHPHEASRIESAYRALDARDDDWIVASRALTPSQIWLYLGAFFLFAGALFYFVAHRVYGAVDGLTGPILILGLPFAGLNLAGRWLYRRDHQAVAVAFYLGGLSLLPLLLLIWLHETGWWIAGAGDSRQLFSGDAVSNRQLQITAAVACAWSVWLALRTRTSALSTVSSGLVLLLGISVLADFGLRDWLDSSRFDLLALHLAPLVAVYFAAGWWLDRSGRAWYASPAFVAAAITLVAVLDLWSIDGKLLHYLGLSMRHLQPADVENPMLLDMLTSLALSGVVFYAVAAAFEGRGSVAKSTAVLLLFTIAPFSILEPLAYLSRSKVYNQRFDWLYLGLAVGIALISYRRQRKSFYYAGLLNSGIALILIANRNQWLDKPAWAITIVGVGIGALLAGFVLDARRRRGSGS
jgi:hypothetical protein